MQGVDCLFLFYWWGHNERGVKSLLCYFKSHVWAVCELRAGLYRVPGDLQGCHRRSRFTQDTLISGCSPGHVHPLPPPPCKKIASRVGQIVVDKGVLCTKSGFFFLRWFYQSISKASTAVSTTTHLKSLTHRNDCSVRISLLTFFYFHP